MVTSIDDALICKALQLGPRERFEFMEILAYSLDKPDAEVDAVWLKEAEARLHAHRRGETTGVPVEQVLGESV